VGYKVNNAEFVTSGTKPKHFPPADRPEFAFGGRSNVGKSSLINTLVNRKKLVKTSKTPGRTQLINFFGVNEDFYFVDLPGYGFAKVPESVKKQWGPMVEGYLGNRPNLVGMVIVMDLRRGVQEDDFELIMAAPHFGVQPILVFTKADKYKKNARIQRRREIAKDIEADPEELVLFSSSQGIGVEKLWQRITELGGR
jgi:GTP-binding protein